VINAYTLCLKNKQILGQPSSLAQLQGGPKNGLFLSADNFATTNVCNMSKVS